MKRSLNWPLLLAAFGCCVAGARTEGQQVRCDTFQPQATLKGNRLEVSLETDLPDATKVSVSVRRSYWAGEPEEEYVINFPVPQEGGTVGLWRRPMGIDVTHAKWRARLDQHLKQLGAAGIPDKVNRIDDDVVVMFTVPVGQDERLLGPRNERLVGKMVPKKGARFIQVERRINHPLAATARAAPAEFVARGALKESMRYEISRRTPLMPDRHPVDPFAAIAQIQRVPAGSILKVLQVDRSDRAQPWYRVTAFAPNGKPIAAGWLNSDALIGQSVRALP